MDRHKNDIDFWKDTWINHYFDMPLWGRALLIGFLAALLGFSLDELAHLFGYPWFFERLGENAAEGIVIGLVVFWLSLLREQRLRRRVREIGFLNHHIRNAMQAIELATTDIADAQQRRAAVNLSINRVVESLSRISRQGDELSLEGGIQLA